MYEKLTKEKIFEKYPDTCSEFSVRHEESRDDNVIQVTQFICNQQGVLFRKMKTGFWKEVKNTKNHTKGYNVIIVDKKQYSRSKLILFAFNKINLRDKNKNIYHKNSNRLDCSLDNLTLEVPSK